MIQVYLVVAIKVLALFNVILILALQGSKVVLITEVTLERTWTRTVLVIQSQD